MSKKTNTNQTRPWTDNDKYLLMNLIGMDGSIHDIACVMKRSESDIILKGLAMGLLTVNRSDFRFPFRTPRDPDPWNDVTLSPRSYEQIQYMAKLFDDKVWHERHKAMRYRIEHGQEQCNPEVWARALEAAKEIEEKYGRHNLGPYTDFEWGMLTGKMVALRWVMGCQWDDLDT